MDFPKVLKRKQLELGMTGGEFAKYLGKSRPWLTQIYCRKETTIKYRLSDQAMYDIEQKLGIEPSIMEQYNKDVREHNERIKKSKSR